MARDRLFFIGSFALLLLIAAFLFRSPEAPAPVKTSKQTVQKPDVKVVTTIPVAPGKLAVPFQLSKRSATVQFMSPGRLVDVIFTSNSDVGFGSVSLTLMKNIRILGIGKDSTGKEFNEKSSFYKPNAPAEILLEMTPREAEIFAYAEEGGTINLVLVEEKQKEPSHETPTTIQGHVIRQFDEIIKKTSPPPKVQSEAKDELVEELMESDSNEGFNSILMTHMIHELIPEANVKVTATPKGYIVTGKVTDHKITEKVMKILQLFIAGSKETIVNLIEEDPKALETFNSLKKVKRVSIGEGKRAIPFAFDTRAPIIKFLKPGVFVDVKFSSKADIGFETINLTILKHIWVLAVGPSMSGKNSEGGSTQVEVLLEMTPKQAEIFSYALEFGAVSLELAEFHQPNERDNLVDTLLKSDSAMDFHSTLITSMIRAIFPYVDVDISASSQGWIVKGKIPDPQMAAKIIEILEKLIPGDEKSVVNLMEIQPQQVLLCVTVFEVLKEVRERVGLNWQLLFDNAGATVAFAAVYPRPPAVDPNYFVDGKGIHFDKFNLSALVDMLERDGYGKILAQPNLTTVSGEKADFFAGGEFPILIPQGGTLAGTVTVEYKKYGVILEFTPVVELNGLITLHVKPEVSSLDRANGVVLAGFIIPGILSRRVDTKVKLWPGQSYIVGGLYLDEYTKTTDSLYGLNKLPLVGPIFNSKHCETRRTELMVMVTPYIMNDGNTPHYDERCNYNSPCQGEQCAPCNSCPPKKRWGRKRGQRRNRSYQNPVQETANECFESCTRKNQKVNTGKHAEYRFDEKPRENRPMPSIQNYSQPLDNDQGRKQMKNRSKKQRGKKY